jgi:hypothetical protein
LARCEQRVRLKALAPSDAFAGSCGLSSPYLRYQRRRKKAGTQGDRRRVRRRRQAPEALDESLTLPSDMAKTTTRSSWKIPSAGACPRCAALVSFLYAVGLMLERSACGKPAEKRCSRCKLEWYCSRWVPSACVGMPRVTCCYVTRDCQVAAWKDHKKLCDVMVSAQAEDAKLGAKATEKENLSHSN